MGQVHNTRRSLSEQSHSKPGLVLTLLASAGRTKEAVALYLETLKINPGYVEAHNNLGVLLFNEGKIADAISHFSEAVRLKPDFEDARRNLNAALAQKARPSPHP